MKILDKAIASARYQLTNNDWYQGLKMAIGGAVGAQLYAIFAQWSASDTFTGIDKHSLMMAAKGAIFAGGIYLAKRFVQKPDIIIKNPSAEAVNAVKNKDAAIPVINSSQNKN